MSDTPPRTREQLRERAKEDPSWINSHWPEAQRILSGQPELPASLEGASNAVLAQAVRERWPEVQEELQRRAKERATSAAETAASADAKLAAKAERPDPWRSSLHDDPRIGR